MSTLLHIDSSPLYGRSVSRELTAAFVNQWKASHPDGRVIDRDLNATAIPPVNAEWVGAAYTPGPARTPQQKELLSLSDSLLAELEQADEYVIGVPMHNFGVPSVLKLWIDQIARVGRTFSYAGERAEGLDYRQEGDLHHCNGRDLRRPDADGLVQFRGAVSAVGIWFSWRDGRDLPHRRGDRCVEPGA
jgi:FMN-dependent NADH-azoreductase